jgi:hypothetical protein
MLNRREIAELLASSVARQRPQDKCGAAAPRGGGIVTSIRGTKNLERMARGKGKPRAARKQGRISPEMIF